MAELAVGRVALLSIHPRHAEAILAGDKRVELRRVPLAAETTHAVIYATAPVQKVVGWFEIDGIDEASQTSIWRLHGAVSGITRQEHRDYYAGSPRAFAIRIARAHRLGKGLPLTELPDVKRPPQSFQYLDPETVGWLFGNAVYENRVS
ncbi:ASCH domain protein [Conexibacter sp. W3-3-2]|uniref:ASCH domain protein n=1 Tax=Conexibacter sp. W3-3-2 TaxID=2675227 RepID=UPI0012B9C80C|nr:ASCH domain protein [Conexibacter sp. W3-3-2]MTD46275.1 ASCH domain protein [Conexibacter sp. W3-3-2]